MTSTLVEKIKEFFHFHTASDNQQPKAHILPREQDNPTQPSQEPLTKHHSFFKPTLPSQKIRIPFLKKLKRYIAGFLFLTNSFFFLLTITGTPTTLTLAMSLFFLLNSFILLDYLWRTSSWRITKKSSEE